LSMPACTRCATALSVARRGTGKVQSRREDAVDHVGHDLAHERVGPHLEWPGPDEGIYEVAPAEKWITWVRLIPTRHTPPVPNDVALWARTGPQGPCVTAGTRQGTCARRRP
jgi:hypothetical protein